MVTLELMKPKEILKTFGQISELETMSGKKSKLNYLIYTRAGHIPHLTWDLVSKHLRLSQNIILQLTLPTL